MFSLFPWRIPAWLAPLSLVTIVVQILIIAISMWQKMKLTRMEYEGGAKAQGMSYALITGIERIKLSGSEKRVLARWLNVYKDKGKAAYTARFPAFVQNELVGFLALAGMLWAFLVGVHSGITVPQFATFASAYALATGAIAYLSTASQDVSLLNPILNLIEPVLQAEPERNAGKSTSKISGKIEMSNVSFRYGPDEPLVLDDLDLQIKAGEYVAIVGKSG